MIEICETWEELVDWCWNKGIYIEGEWGKPKTIVIDLSGTNCDLPFKIVKFDEFGVYFDGVYTFNLLPRYKHFMIQALTNMNKENK